MIETKGLQGFRELDRALKALPIKLQKNVTEAALRKAVKPMVDAAKENAPVADAPHRGLGGVLVQPGAMRKTIRTSRKKFFRAKFVTVGYYIGPFKKKGGHDPFYWRFVEFGTKFISAQPFLRPAFDENVEKVISRMRDELFKGIEKQKRKLGFPK